MSRDICIINSIIVRGYTTLFSRPSQRDINTFLSFQFRFGSIIINKFNYNILGQQMHALCALLSLHCAAHGAQIIQCAMCIDCTGTFAAVDIFIMVQLQKWWQLYVCWCCCCCVGTIDVRSRSSPPPPLTTTMSVAASNCSSDRFSMEPANYRSIRLAFVCVCACARAQFNSRIEELRSLCISISSVNCQYHK